jgi:hypothetical protein
LNRSGPKPLVVLALAVCSLACAPAVLAPVDPEHAAAVEALGPEDPRVPAGPLHRAGQPCVLCHDLGAEAPAFTFAGTAYRDNVSKTPLVDADVGLVDSVGYRYTVHTNCAGNFYVSATDYEPTWPFWVTVSQGANATMMGSPVHRERSCAACHGDPASPGSAGHVFLTSDDLVIPTITTRACRPGEGG